MLNGAAPVVIEAVAQHTASMIFLHGLGDTAYGWAPEMRELSKRFHFMKFILPTAPNRKVTLNMGMKMPSWYDIYTLDENDEREDEAGLRQSMSTVIDLISKEKAAGISAERIFLGGFSQGGAVSLFTTLLQPELKLGGIIALSTYVPCRKYLKSQPLKPLSTPIFMAHGTADEVVQYLWHQSSATFLKNLGGEPVTLKNYKGMTHSACEEEIIDIIEYIQAQLAITDQRLKTQL